jgi:hypothetical protein
MQKPGIRVVEVFRPLEHGQAETHQGVSGTHQVQPVGRQIR